MIFFGICWERRPGGLGHGGKVPEELTGALLAAANLEWNADEKLMVVTLVLAGAGSFHEY